MTTTSNAIRLDGYLAPVPDEIDAHDLTVHGTLPPELCGRYLRNGPNPRPGESSPHWFTGHGMVHGVRLNGGRAEWYRNRWVRTRALQGERAIEEDGTVHLDVGVANTHVLAYAGRLLALVESSFPHVLTPDLDTVGTCDFDGRLSTAMTAHPKADPVTGELHFFGRSPRPPYLTYHRLSADGELVVSADIDVPGPSFMHDFAITSRHAVFLDLPLTFQMDLRPTGMPYGWDDGYPARIGVMPLDEPGSVRWFDVEPGYVFHVGNAHTDEAGRVVLDAARYTPDAIRHTWAALGADPSDPVSLVAGTGRARLHRWVLDPGTGRATETPLDDRGIEFPTLDDDRVGRAARYRYAVADAHGATGVVKLDVENGTSALHDLGADTRAGEAVFVPSGAPGRAEDDGWLLTIATRRDGSASQLLVLDATDVAGPPVAAVDLPRGVPAGFHGSFVTDDELDLS